MSKANKHKGNDARALSIREGAMNRLAPAKRFNVVRTHLRAGLVLRNRTSVIFPTN